MDAHVVAMCNFCQQAGEGNNVYAIVDAGADRSIGALPSEMFGAEVDGVHSEDLNAFITCQIFLGVQCAWKRKERKTQNLPSLIERQRNFLDDIVIANYCLLYGRRELLLVFLLALHA